MSKISDAIRKHPLVVNSELTESAKDELAKEVASENYLEVKKPNIITQKGKFNFNAVQQDLVNFMFWKFDEIDYENRTLTLQCEEIVKLLNLQRGGRTNTWIKNIFKDIKDKSIWIPVNDPEYEEETFSYFSKVKIKKGSGDIVLEFEQSTLNFLILGATKYFTLYNFFDIFKLKGKYAKRIFELLVSFVYKTNQYTTTMENFKELLHFSYDYQSDIERKIIIPALQEINDNTRLDVDYKIKDNKITFIYTTQSLLKHSLELNEKYQKLYEKVKQKEEEEKGIIDKNSKNISYFRHIFEKDKEDIIDAEVKEVKETNKKDAKKEEQELREKIEKELRAKIEQEFREREKLSERMEKEKRENEEIHEIVLALEKYNVPMSEWRQKTWDELKELVKKLENK